VRRDDVSKKLEVREIKAEVRRQKKGRSHFFYF
jgi:hypothetical protein